MSRIHAIALNTAVDVRMAVPEFKFGAVMRSTEFVEFAAGKAVNAARAADGLGGQVNLYCFCGANDASLYASSVSKRVTAHILPVSGVTRRNLTLVQADGQIVCHIQNRGYALTAAHLEKLRALLDASVREGDVAIISGSLPDGVSVEDLRDLAARLTAAKTRLILDVDPKFLRDWRGAGAEIVKPNLQELSAAAGRELRSHKEIVQAALASFDAPTIVVSMGKDGALWVDRRRNAWLPGRTTAAAPSEANVIGCGDSLVAGLAVGLAEGKAPEDILRVGLAAGFAHLFGPAPGVIPMDRFKPAEVALDAWKPA